MLIPEDKIAKDKLGQAMLRGVVVTKINKDILATQKLLVEREGIFCEPTSAISVASALRDLLSGKIPFVSGVFTLTGRGSKDPDIAMVQSTIPMLSIDATSYAVCEAIFDDINTKG